MRRPGDHLRPVETIDAAQIGFGKLTDYWTQVGNPQPQLRGVPILGLQELSAAPWLSRGSILLVNCRGLNKGEAAPAHFRVSDLDESLQQR
jgi:hypothetical protein